MIYNDPAHTVETKKLVTAGVWWDSLAQVDGLGRTIQTQLLSDPAGTSFVDTTYDAFGRTNSVSNSYRTKGESTYGITSYRYDALDRKLLQQQSDGSSIMWSYAGNVTNIYDELQHHTQQTTDALGRLIRVMEPDPSTGQLALESDYVYDPLGNLTSVNQKGNTAKGDAARLRSFTYDSVSRLITANNPETGTVCYGQWNSGSCTGGYDGSGNVLYKTDARHTTVKYSYDQINRLVSKTYISDLSATPIACYQYDSPSSSSANAIGHLTYSWTAPSGTSCSASQISSGYLTLDAFAAYDPMGRIWNEEQCTPAGCYTSTACPGSPQSHSYAYDLAGNLTCSTNGIASTPGTSAPLTFTSAYDTAGRLQAVQSSWTPVQNGIINPACVFEAQTTSASSTPACSLTTTTPYAPFGGLSTGMYGNGAFTQNRNYDLRLRVYGETNTSGH